MRTFIYSLRCTIITITLLFICLPVIAIAATGAEIGKVLWVKGLVIATQQDVTKRTLERRSSVFEQDTLTTDAKSTAQIVFSDDSMLSIRENTTLKISAYSFKKGEKTAKESFVVDVVKGGFRTVTGMISKNNPDGYQAKTPVATIAVRGTIYSLYYIPDTGKKGLVVKIDSGEISIKNKGGEIVLGCTKKPCHMPYARIGSENSKPVRLKTMPAEFKQDAPVKASSWQKIVDNKPMGGDVVSGSQSGGPTIGGGDVGSVSSEVSTGGTSGSTSGGVVSGFCIK